MKHSFFILLCIITVTFADGLSPKELSEVVSTADYIGEVKVLVFEGDTTFTIDPGGSLKSQEQTYLIAGKIGWMYKGARSDKRHAIFRHTVQILKGFWFVTDASGIEPELQEGRKYIFFWKDRGDGRLLLLRAEEITSRTRIMEQLGQLKQ